MKKNSVIVIEKEKSTLKTVLKITTSVLAVAAGCAAVYKYIENKYRSTVLGKVDLDGDGVAEAVMLDTTGNGEVDTILLDSNDDGETSD